MIGFGPATRVYLAAGAIDVRKSFDGLYGLARDRLGIDPLDGHLFRVLEGASKPPAGALPGYARK
jgi:IS66 Orf2 like protein